MMSNKEKLVKTIQRLLEDNSNLTEETIYLKAMLLGASQAVAIATNTELDDTVKSLSELTAQHLNHLPKLASVFDEIIAKLDSELKQENYRSHMETIYKEEGN